MIDFEVQPVVGVEFFGFTVGLEVARYDLAEHALAAGMASEERNVFELGVEKVKGEANFFAVEELEEGKEAGTFTEGGSEAVWGLEVEVRSFEAVLKLVD